MDFHNFQAAIRAQFQRMQAHDLFCTAATGDGCWITYIDSFPPGTNPMFRKRTEHDCSCCKGFIRKVGNVVAIIDGELVSIWDTLTGDPTYDIVAKALSQYVKSEPITDIFLHYEQQIGTEKNADNETTRIWNHFALTLPARRNSGRQFIVPKKNIATILGQKRDDHQVLKRSLTELTMEAVDTVNELITSGTLYRGNDHKNTIQQFKTLKTAFDKLDDVDRDLFVWSKLESVGPAIARVRNTSIGTLLIDLSNDVDLEVAVRKFEAVMAPTNYKRPTALVTKAMVDKARATLEELGLTPSLRRRYAKLSDIGINDVLWANRSIKPALKGDVFDDIATAPKKPRKLDGVQQMPLTKFLTDVVPNVSSIEVMLENRHRNNLVSLIAPVEPDAKPLFKWDNRFSWAYQGDLTDSIKEKVKRAGGNVTGDFCARLAWYNYDDLDFHLRGPAGLHIYYGNKRQTIGGFQLDVDMNAGGGSPGRGTREPVENIFAVDRRHIRPGTYDLQVNQFSRMETQDVGFEVEVDFLGEIWNFAYTKAVHGTVSVMKFQITKDGKLEVLHSLPTTTASKTFWNLKTNEWHPVTVLLNSPNYWEGEKGVLQKHTFFMLQDCVRDDEARGFFNEFLNPELDKHRKVMEIVGGKMKTEATENQLSGLGFADKSDKLLVRVQGNITRTLEIQL